MTSDGLTPQEAHMCKSACGLGLYLETKSDVPVLVSYAASSCLTVSASQTQIHFWNTVQAIDV